ncbi:MAG: ATP-binding cassette domain-containing protein [Chloroflexi bacterium]|jgi:lipopolysaccharide transport system ATP-binding protein|nr:ATP-binding cassette domain-containing protein [Chloroflexota bacterium]OQY79634.1 MAG: hypothetical protein B6D42_14725 [Anaerolineae bacterium UTCFX5]
MKPENAIEVEHLSKVYYVAATAEARSRRAQMLHNVASPVKRLRSALAGQAAFGAEVPLKALDDISFEVGKGQIVGLIGSNGSGKSTLLKVLSRITTPTSGQAQIRGTLGSLLEVGTGFHPELTGRENIYMNGAVLGMDAREINRLYDRIIEFSGVGAFIDTPVKRYSSGMKVRLGFSVAAFFQSDVLLVDEVLSVGDAEFQKRGLGKMSQVSREGRTVIMVSHNLSAILSHCDWVIWLNKGKIMTSGDPTQVTSAYLLENTASGGTSEGEKHFTNTPADSPYPFKLIAMRTFDSDGNIRSTYLSSMPVIVEMEFELSAPIDFLRVGFELKSTDENSLFRSFHNDIAETLEYDSARRTYKLRGVISPRLLNNGTYYVDPLVAIHRGGWIVNNTRGLTVSIVYDIPNRDYMIKQRPGLIAPVLEWYTVAESEAIS